VSSSSQDFVKAAGTPLGDTSLDDTFIDLHSGALSDGPIAELIDPKSGYGLRIIPLTTNVISFAVKAPAAETWVSIAPNTNLPDPFGHEWENQQDPGMVILEPGDKLVWRVRLEIFATGATAPR